MTSDLLTAVCPETKAQNALAARRFASTLVAINPPLPAPKPRTKFDSTKRRPQEEVKKKSMHSPQGLIFHAQDTNAMESNNYKVAVVKPNFGVPTKEGGEERGFTGAN